MRRQILARASKSVHTLSLTFGVVVSILAGHSGIAFGAEPRALSAALYGGALLVLRDAGTENLGSLLSWDLGSDKLASSASTPASHEGLTHIAVTDDRLWGVADGTMLEWSPKAGKWKSIARFKTGNETPELLASVGSRRLIIFPSKVVDPIAGRSFPLPKISGNDPPFEISATLEVGSNLWLGMNVGELGGALLRLDLKSGKWKIRTTALPVTGLAQEGEDEVIASSGRPRDFSNERSRIQTFQLDGLKRSEFNLPEDEIVRTIAFNPFDGVVYGVTSSELISVERGTYKPITSIEPEISEEPSAILALLTVGADKMVIVPVSGCPWKIESGKLYRLSAPTSAAEKSDLDCDYRMGIKGPPLTCKPRKSGSVRGNH